MNGTETVFYDYPSDVRQKILEKFSTEANLRNEIDAGTNGFEGQRSKFVHEESKRIQEKLFGYQIKPSNAKNRLTKYFIIKPGKMD